MTTDEQRRLLDIATRNGIPMERLVQLYNAARSVPSVLYHKPRGPAPRPDGYLSSGEARLKYNLSAADLVRCRKEGVRFRVAGQLTAFSDSDLQQWLAKNLRV